MGSTTPSSPDNQLSIIMPLFNDWESFQLLVENLNTSLGSASKRAEIIAVNDSSIQPMPEMDFEHCEHVSDVKVINLSTNVGHQRAIAIGLSRILTSSDSGLIAVMDSDGEDTPEELMRLVEAAEASPEQVIVAQRARRSESASFRLFYKIFKLAFRLLTGQKISFGNFVVLPKKWALRLVNDPRVWNHFAASIVSSRLPTKFVPTTRGDRYAGQSKMNFVGLVAHGLGAISIFSEAVFIRICIVSAGLFSLSALAAVTSICLRLFTDTAIPGWTTNALGFALLASLQALLLPVMMAFLLLSNRTVIQRPPRSVADEFVENVVSIKSGHRVVLEPDAFVTGAK